ncbi:hypothetical protein [Pedobacter sp. FW305-3-2-15-E-R2A2]|uniref:hypothetical protein n=1 Tax=Pedobacter sp. FW305-3-2-15-E-R2A2 TaxID=3140251 RepID=UPI0031405AFB
MKMRSENEYDAEKLDELQRINQFIEQDRSFVLDQFTAYRDKVKGVEILRLKMQNHKSTFKHEFNLGVLSLDQYNKKIEILNEKLMEQELIRRSIDNQFITKVFGVAPIALPRESIISYLQQVFL